MASNGGKRGRGRPKKVVVEAEKQKILAADQAAARLQDQQQQLSFLQQLLNLVFAVS